MGGCGWLANHGPPVSDDARHHSGSIGSGGCGWQANHSHPPLLEAQGYKIRTSPQGPDGAVDIIAGKGVLGFDPPRLAVHVKSGSSPVDVKDFRELQGVMKNLGAEPGLIVAWGGFANAVLKEAARLFFEVRLWNSGDLAQMIQSHYEGLPDALQAELPLERIWTLVPSEE